MFSPYNDQVFQLDSVQTASFEHGQRDDRKRPGQTYHNNQRSNACIDELRFEKNSQLTGLSLRYVYMIFHCYMELIVWGQMH